ncbi:ABC transporter permease [Bradyrhizobium sp. U87765 SZCCT0131]|uniref:ABC transporter permease n=1 Tax=unclassified Bradyrhizobium TaxID=2631580 RepID=UPI001BA47DF5|nr:MULTISPECIES: ABC transporter permease [unclassified Bradyrhizobium]MBR1222985.1 ABC transporter permease [Bradyrhizobium sp. U87765 SZCCT0131]MBR1262721.1 ABC transporter permease [Bradyrhizobium sp. U87765 SZCCT0134]MBR1308807.1 ABC transporter permease [Bradyrhizobium sp. U87765 SZCCT0110]MBR1318503.1 ABC transporter permease [Bradyrhizobium sp. U87765 SZCCT0109]MBR1352207.1 ABC transporter permease [Bradyrhizobium sp. U87765 SZCCT0048]
MMSSILRLPGQAVEPRTISLAAVLILLGAAFHVLTPFFFTAANLSNLFLSISVLGIMAAMSTLSIIGRSIDLSVGSIAALVGVVVALLIEKHGVSAPAAMALGLVVGGICGAVNGALAAFIGINPIIVTIGTLSLFRGLAFILTDGQTTLIQDEGMLFLGDGRVLGVPVSVLILAVAFLCCHVTAVHTVAGRAIFAAGANPRAARLAGLPVIAIRFWLFVASGMAAAISGVLLACQSGTAIPSAATTYEILVVTAVLLGGTSLAGGDGALSRTAIGLLIIGTLNNGMALLAVPTFYQMCANGLLLLLAVTVDQVRGRRLGVVEE